MSKVANDVATDVHLLVPVKDVQKPELSIVVPALNEELTIAEFVRWCHEGLQKASVTGEILIVDSSTDRTAQIALSEGARVLKTPKRGLGRAYIDALPYIRGKYVVMGDADCTYDFREIGAFLEQFRQGYEFIMGSRFRGYIEPGSMPALHRYLGTPVTTWILNVLYSSRFSDIHCGMRGITHEGLRRIGLTSQSWEYASEMVLKSVHTKLRTTEVPVRFLKDKEGRVSHHLRAGWFSPWQAAWINLRAMFIHGADFFLFRPGLILMVAGLLATLPLTLGPITLGSITLSLYTMLVGLTLTLIGLQSFFLGCIAQVIYDYFGEASRRWTRVFRYTRTVFLSVGAFVLGALLMGLLVVHFFKSGMELGPVGRLHHLAVFGLLLVLGSFMTFTFTLLMHAAVLKYEAPRGPS